MTNKEMQTAVENWYMSGTAFNPHFTANGEEYAVFARYGISDSEFDVFKVRTYTIGETVYEGPYYNPETREPIDRIAVVKIPGEIITKKKEQISEANRNNKLFEEFFKI